MATVTHTITGTVRDSAGAMSAYQSSYLSTTPPGGFAFQPLRVGAGGQICNIMFANDGTAVIRCDSFGGFVLPAGTSKWVQLCQASALPAEAVVPLTAFGIYATAIAPSNSSIMYMLYGQVAGGGPYLFVTANQGTTWMRCTNWTQVAGNSSSTGGQPRLYGPKAAVDPASPDDFIVTMQDGKAYETINGTSGASATFTQLSTITTGTANQASSVCFEPTTSATYGTTGGRSNNCYVSSYGQGLFLRTTPTGSFSLIAGSSTTIYRVRAAVDGTIYIVTSGGALIRLTWSAGPGSTPTFTTITPAISVNDVALNPANASQLTSFGYVSGWQNSINAGASWTSGIINSGSEYTATSADATWLTTQRSLSYTQGSIQSAVADPSGTGKIFFAGWQGLYTTAYPTPPSTPIALTTLCHGIEQLAANVIVVPPGGNAILCQQDGGVALSGLGESDTNPDALSACPAVQGWNNTVSLSSCNHADWASTDPTLIVGMLSDDGLGTPANSAFNTHSGTGAGSANWKAFGASLPQAGTCVAVADANNWVVVADSNLYRTNNGGGTWTQITSPGGNASATSGWWPTFTGISGHWKCVCADRVLNGSSTYTFYAFHPSQGLFTSIDNGVTWTDVGVGAITSLGAAAYAEMKAVGGNQGHLFFSLYTGSGGSPASAYPNVQNFRFYRSTNGGTTWAVVGPASLGVTGTILEVWSWDLGAAATGQTYPAIYIYGWIFTGAATYSGYSQGIWRCSNIASINAAGGWEQLSGPYPDQWTDYVKSIAADKNVYGRVYFAKNGSSYGVGQILT